jgi:hypothetical protein
MIRKQKEYINAERFQGSKVFKLIKDQKDLEEKIRIQNSITNKLNKQLAKYSNIYCNDDCVKN